MSPVYQSFALLLSLVLLQSYFGEAIRCYNCTHLEPDCEAPEKDKYLVDCSENANGVEYKFCRKMDMWVDFKVNKQEPFKRVLRQCAVDEEQGKPCYYKAGMGGRVNVCHCSGDGCNEAHSIRVLTSLLFVPVLVAIFKFL